LARSHNRWLSISDRIGKFPTATNPQKSPASRRLFDESVKLLDEGSPGHLALEPAPGELDVLNFGKGGKKNGLHQRYG
jgi:hypothetical protein